MRQEFVHDEAAKTDRQEFQDRQWLKNTGLVNINHIPASISATTTGYDVVCVPEETTLNKVDGKKGLGKRWWIHAFSTGKDGPRYTRPWAIYLRRREEAWVFRAPANLSAEEKHVHLSSRGLWEVGSEVRNEEEVESTEDGGTTIAGGTEGAEVTVAAVPIPIAIQGALGGKRPYRA